MEHKSRENYVWILDYVATGTPKRFWKKEPIPYAQAIGEDHFILLELQVLEEKSLAVGQRISLSSSQGEKRTVTVLSRIFYDDLTTEAKENLPKVLRRIVEFNEQKFVSILNSMGLLTPKLHSFELLAGIGKNTARKIIEKREKGPFTSFNDFKERTKIDNIEEIIVKRIVEELSTKQKYRLFVR